MIEGVLRNYLQHLLQHWAGEHLFNEELLQEYGFYMVGAASSREYRISIELSRFIAAGSRSHKAIIPQSRAKASLKY